MSALLPVCFWPTEAEVDDAIARGLVLGEEWARVDLARQTVARPDAWYAKRWRWSEAEVDALRAGDWRGREALPRGRR